MQNSKRCCQTNANQSQLSSNLNLLGCAEAAPLGKSGALSFVVPESVGHDRVFAVVPGKEILPTIHDITTAVRQSFGGFSEVSFETVKGRSGELFPPPYTVAQGIRKYVN